MNTTTDYQTWLKDIALSDDEDAYDLYDSLMNFEGSGRFYTTKEVTNDGYQYFIKSEGTLDSLFLESDQAKFDFINYLASNYTSAEDGDIQKWYNLKNELGRTD